MVVKREGVSTVRAPGDASGAPTVQSALPALLTPSRADARALWRPRPVHRLDKPTHGLVLCAKTERALRALSRALEQRQVAKRYRAVVVASEEGDRLASVGTVATPLRGRAARTVYRVVRRARAAMLVDLHPRTGRTHQLRRHCAEQLGCGIVGDERYGGPEASAVRPLRGPHGLFLAAVEVKLRHPTTGALLHVEIDEPPRFAALLDALDGTPPFTSTSTR